MYRSNLNIKIILIGNKIDLERKVTTEEGQKLADHFQYPFFETSAKNNIGINEAIRNLVTSIYILKEDNLGEKEFQGKFNLNNKKIDETNIKTNKCKC
jgi:GTPase SAR1 family protein